MWRWHCDYPDGRRFNFESEHQAKAQARLHDAWVPRGGQLARVYNTPAYH